MLFVCLGCPKGWDEWEGKCMSFSGAKQIWLAANHECYIKGGSSLLTMDTRNISLFLKDKPPVWTAAVREFRDGINTDKWYWFKNAGFESFPLDAGNGQYPWSTIEPNNYDNNEACAIVNYRNR